MFGLTGLRLAGVLGTALAFALLLAWALRVDSLRANWKRKYDGLSNEVTIVLPAIRDASGNPKLQWRPGKGDEQGVAEQIRIVGRAKASWQQTATDQSQRIAELGAETQRLKALGQAERRKAEAAIAQRNSALLSLEQQALTPGERADCQAQLRSAEDALDLVYAEGL